MNARLRQVLARIAETFWVLPAVLTLCGVVGALLMLRLDRSGLIPPALLDGGWLYDGGGTGARTLLGAVASSTIGVAGTVFSITIAALSLAAGQMGPRLLRNFTRDRGNQVTLGIFVATFSYALMVLRSVRTQSEGEFVPHAALSVGIFLAFVCVATLIYFVGHMASRINVDTVIDLVSDDLRDAIARLTSKEEAEDVRTEPCDAATPLLDNRRGYLQHVDVEVLADWAARHRTRIRLLVRPGDYRFPGTPIALVDPPVDGAGAAIRAATALGPARVSDEDLEFAVRQLVEVAVRALSPGINDPNTAIGVLDRLGAALCRLSGLHLDDGIRRRDGRVVMVVPGIDYAGLTDAMFQMIRQNGAGSTPVLMHLVEVLTAVLGCEHDPRRRAALRRHADLVVDDARREIRTPADRADVQERHEAFVAALARPGVPLSDRRAPR